MKPLEILKNFFFFRLLVLTLLLSIISPYPAWCAGLVQESNLKNEVEDTSFVQEDLLFPEMKSATFVIGISLTVAIVLQFYFPIRVDMLALHRLFAPLVPVGQIFMFPSLLVGHYSRIFLTEKISRFLVQLLFISPIVEEFSYRYVFQNGLEFIQNEFVEGPIDDYTFALLTGSRIGLSALFFALGHKAVIPGSLNDQPQIHAGFYPQLIAGLHFALVFEYTKSITTAIALHTIGNFLSITFAMVNYY